MAATGPIDSWNNNPLDVGPIYPFAGWEVLLCVAAAALWLAWTVWQIRNENATLEKESRRLTSSALSQIAGRAADRR